MWRAWIWASVLATVCVAAPSHDAPLTVFKCCEEGEELDLMVQDQTKCRPIDYENNIFHEWRPHVYDPVRSTLHQGVLPHWLLKTGVVECDSDQELLKVPVEHQNTPSYVLYSNGSVYLTEYSMVVSGAGAYCLDARQLLVCVPKGPENAPSEEHGPPVRKCCVSGAAYISRGNHTACEDASALGVGTLPLDPEVFALRVGSPSCAPGVLVEAGRLRASDAVLKPDGSLVLEQSGPAALRPLEFCLEHMLTAVGEGPPAGADEPPRVFTCYARIMAGARPQRRPDPAFEDDIRFTLYPVGLVLSVFFLAATLAAGCLLPGAHHALHWRCQTAYVACLMVGDLLLAVAQLAGASLAPALCRTVAVTMHFFFMAAFLWLNTMCWNIWWTFRDLHPARLDKSQEVRRLRFCHLYAWGISFLIAGLGLLFDKLPDSHTGFIRPRFGHQSCWFADDTEIFVYFYVPMGLTLTVNLILFALTARALTCGLWKQEVVKSSTERATLSRVCLKLVVVMGLTWVVDIISWAAGGPDYIWYFTDLINALQGVFIFAVVGCQQQVWAAVNRLWCWYIPRAGSSATGQHVSTYSQGLPSLGESVTHSHTHKSAPLETMC